MAHTTTDEQQSALNRALFELRHNRARIADGPSEYREELLAQFNTDIRALTDIRNRLHRAHALSHALADFMADQDVVRNVEDDDEGESPYTW